MTTDPTRIPITRSVSYAVRGAPEMPAHGAAVPGTTLAPTQVTFTYRAAPDSQRGRVQARVRGFWRRDGSRVNPGQPMAQHYFGDPSGWPEWLAEEARLHDPDAHPAVGPAPATDQAALRRIAELESSCRDVDRLRRDWVEMRDRAEALDARVQALTTAVLPAPADRAAVLREAADRLVAAEAEARREGALDWTLTEAADLLRRLADETPQPETVRCTCGGRFPLGHLHADSHQPAAPAVAQPDEEAKPRQSCACGQDGCEHCDVDEEADRG